MAKLETLQQEIVEAITKRTEARAALAALPEDTPEAMRRTMQKAAKKAEDAILALNARMEQENARIEQEEAWREEDEEARKGQIASLTAGEKRTGLAIVLGVGALIFMFMALSEDDSPSPRHPKSYRAPSYTAPQEEPPSRSFTVSPRDQSAFTTAAAQNIACQQAGFAGAVLVDMECFPDTFGDCTRAEITMSCTRSRREHQEGIRKLREFAGRLGQ